MVGLHPVQPDRLVGPGELLLRFPRDSAVPIGMTSGQRRAVFRPKLLGTELAQGFEQPEPHLAGCFVNGDQRALPELGQIFQSLRGFADGLGGFGGPAAPEDR